MRTSNPARIFDRVTKSESGCWLYTGGISSTGYGIASVKGRSAHVHRMAFELRCGEIPDGMCVLHRCDVRRCINPDHLFLGTLADNNRDTMQKDRTDDRRGEKNTQVKFTDEQVKQMRSMYASGLFSQRQIASTFKASQQHVSQIVRGVARSGKRRRELVNL
ncbi:HNH endonuclease signature motif containing protein [Gemmata sp. JC717]|uniref:HNH endonuclease signature motif containing protein n=1 Tax=Gemmata algarum TaxID=2975278 RepID=UPI0021BB86DA|nr:HNH endonuclease signature motif containing protein [Gemmata algarum]MDY3555321.1 HNH endonuclease signature motif containing protein [Gemmata algarum]